jgi:hypothetical protein
MPGVAYSYIFKGVYICIWFDIQSYQYQMLTLFSFCTLILSSELKTKKDSRIYRIRSLAHCVTNTSYMKDLDVTASKQINM